jgi:hypothetical protein
MTARASSAANPWLDSAAMLHLLMDSRLPFSQAHRVDASRAPLQSPDQEKYR